MAARKPCFLKSRNEITAATVSSPIIKRMTFVTAQRYFILDAEVQTNR
jgi:hypothetical protein